MLIFRLFICCLFLVIPSFKAQAQDQTPAQLLQNVQASLVAVRAVDTKTFNEDNGHTRVGTYQALGSGIIIDSHGIIVTNTHIIANAGRIFVGLSDGTILEAKLVYSSDADFSFIKIDPPYPLQTITWADSSLAGVGTPIIALTSGEDNQEHILGGEITSLINGVDSNNVELLELNLNLIPGDSGGPLLDSQGHLLGMIMAKRKSEDDKTYAIASNKIQQEYSQYEGYPPN
jgi:S1-C subfamily serine protease